LGPACKTSSTSHSTEELAPITCSPILSSRSSGTWWVLLLLALSYNDISPRPGLLLTFILSCLRRDRRFSTLN
jgi:hypothetical protein